MEITLGSRDSALAVAQSQEILAQLQAQNPQHQFQLVTMLTTGDKILDRTLDKIGGKGLFVKELDQALREKRVDFTVHSCKDIPLDPVPDLPLLAFSKREDPRDVLVLPQGVTQLDPSKPIGTASQRRSLQGKSLFPHMDIAPIRGNLQTRLAKLDRGDFSALILAAAGLHRLGLQARISRYFTTEEMLPAGGQGILVVQGREKADYISPLDHPESRLCATAERSFVATLEGGCSSPVAAYAQVMEGKLFLQGMNAKGDKGSLWGNCNLEESQRLGETLANTLK